MFKRQLSLIVLTLLIASEVLGAAVFGPALPPYFRLEQKILNEIKRKKLIGGAFAVIEKGEIVLVKSFGVRKKGEAELVNDDSVFQLGSLSKPIAASLFSVAQKDQRLSLNTPVIFENLKWTNTEARHLLSHTSGLSRSGWNWKVENGRSRSQLIDLLGKNPPKTPGRNFDYHNVAFSLVENLLEQSFKTSFENAMEEHLLKRIGMSRTTVGFGKFAQQNNRTWPHECRSSGQCKPEASYSHFYHDTIPSAGGINSSINDMAKFLKLQVGGFPDLLTTSDLKPFQTPVIEAPDGKRFFKNRLKGDYSSFYGYGWRVLKSGNEQFVFHAGWVKGYTSFLMFSPKDRRGIVMLSNTETRLGLDMAIDFFDINHI